MREKRMVAVVRSRGQFLRFGERLGRLQQVVETANLREIDREHIVAEKIA